jgi:hypothetical protein
VGLFGRAPTRAFARLSSVGSTETTAPTDGVVEAEADGSLPGAEAAGARFSTVCAGAGDSMFGLAAALVCHTAPFAFQNANARVPSATAAARDRKIA